MPAAAAGRRGVGLRGLAVVRHTPYRIDIDIYQMGARAWLTGRPLYGGGCVVSTHPSGLNPPVHHLHWRPSCSPIAWLQMPAASVAITVLTLVLLIASTAIVLTGLDAWPTSRLSTRAGSVTPVVVGRASSWLRQRFGWKPISSNFAFGQINGAD